MLPFPNKSDRSTFLTLGQPHSEIAVKDLMFLFCSNLEVFIVPALGGILSLQGTPDSSRGRGNVTAAFVGIFFFG